MARPARTSLRRRVLLGTVAAGAVAGLAGWRLWPEQGLFNPCLGPDLPDTLRDHELVRAAWNGVHAAHVWDGHVHLVGVGDGDSGIWVTPRMQQPWHPLRFAQYRFYLNAACVAGDSGIDKEFTDRLVWLAGDLAPGAKLMLLAFDYAHDERGRRRPDLSTFHTPNAYAQRIAGQYPRRFEWIASIHPYREDCVEALEAAVNGGARAVKWLPPAMGMDPASALCDRFYDAMARLDVPLLSHAGDERAVHAGDWQRFGNPLRLRRALQRGVRVIVAHCASLGRSVDLDAGASGALRPSFDLFARMMGEREFEGRLFGEISAMTQINRLDSGLQRVITESAWQQRLLNASDYPLPGIPPLFPVQPLVRLGYLAPADAPVLLELRQYNPILFDFVLKRRLRVGGHQFSPSVFETRRVFQAAAQQAAAIA